MTRLKIALMGLIALLIVAACVSSYDPEPPWLDLPAPHHVSR